MTNKTTSRHIADLVLRVNVNRSIANLPRRVLKLLEEIGETAQAYLCVTSTSPSKVKSWEDVREEAADVLIVAIDIALTPGVDGDPERDDRYMTPHDIDDIPRMLRNVARKACDIGDFPFLRPSSDSEEIVRHAYMLTDRVFDNDASLIQEVERKLAKWVTLQNRQEPAVVHPN